MIAQYRGSDSDKSSSVEKDEIANLSHDHYKWKCWGKLFFLNSHENLEESHDTLQDRYNF